MWVNSNGCPDLTTLGSFEFKTYTAGVRCCSMDASTCITPEDHTCQGGDMPYDDAVLKCAETGDRLCTRDELLLRQPDCCGTGGSCDARDIWTSTSESGTHLSFFLKHICVGYFTHLRLSHSNIKFD